MYTFINTYKISLFENYKFDQKPHPIVSAYPEIGANLFFNGTRNQLRGIGDY